MTEKVEGTIAPASQTPFLTNQTQMLFALMRKTRHVFQGIDNAEEYRVKRNKRNKVARKQRKLNAKHS